MSETRMRRFWDRRAREDPFYFVDNRRRYGDPDIERFFAQGERDLDAFLELLGASVSPHDTMVEIGCGVGRLTRPLARRAARVVALDVSPVMLMRAQELNPDLDNVEWRAGDGVSLAGLEDGSADACISAVVFQHLPEPEITLGYVREIGRVLRTGGWAAIHVSNDPGLHRPRFGLARELQALLGRAARGQGHPAWLGSAVDIGELRGAAADAGLAMERIEGEGTQYCCALLVKTAPRPPAAT